MGHVALTAVGKDQPGIVAALTGALAELGCNLEDSSMSILRGHFAVLLVVAVPDGVEAEAIEAAVTTAVERLDLVVAVRPLRDEDDEDVVGVGDSPSAEAGDEGESYTFSVHGADRPGIVHGAAQALMAEGGNVVDLSTRLVGTPAAPVYVMTLTVGFPPDVDAEPAAARVCTAVEALGVQCRAHRVQVDVL